MAAFTLFNLLNVQLAHSFVFSAELNGSIISNTSIGNPVIWEVNLVDMNLGFGAPGGQLINGTTTWDENAISALEEWNAVPSKFDWFPSVSVGDPCSFDYANFTGWMSTICGDPFGDALAVTRTISQSLLGGPWHIVDTDLIVNTNFPFNAYSGPLVPAGAGGILNDFRRVVLHEFGHALGLGHPDLDGQVVPSIMNSVISNTGSLTADDEAGIQFLYGAEFPDLVVDSLSASKSSVEPGGSLTVNYEIGNQGEGGAGAHSIQFRLSTDSIITSLDTLLASTSGESLDGGETSGLISQIVTIPPIVAPGTYFLGIILDASSQVSEENEANNTSSIIITILQPNRAPDSQISNPAGNVTIKKGNKVNFAGSCTDPDTTQGMTYKWTFGSGSGISNSTLEDPGLKTFEIAGVYSVTFACTDNFNLADPTPDAVTITVEKKDGGKKGKCFIATAAYGSYLDPHVVVLRQFRDKYLLKSDVGRSFVKFYYEYSPPLAEYISKHELIKGITRGLLTPLVYGVKYPSIFMGVLIMVVASFVGVRRIRRGSMLRGRTKETY